MSLALELSSVKDVASLTRLSMSALISVALVDKAPSLLASTKTLVALLAME